MDDIDTSLRIFECTGDPDDLEEATLLVTEAMQVCPPGHKHRATVMQRYGNVLQADHRQKNGSSNTSDVIAGLTEALDVRPPGHPGRRRMLDRLSHALMERYMKEECIVDLQKAVAYEKEAVDLTPKGHKARYSAVRSLSHSFDILFYKGHRIEDSDAALAYGLEALSLCPPGDVNEPWLLGSLGCTYQGRYQITRDVRCLDDSINFHERGLKLNPAGSRENWRLFSMYGVSRALRDRYDAEHKLTDLQHAIKRAHGALALTPPGIIDRGRNLVNLTSLLLIRYHRLKNTTDSNDAVMYSQEALREFPPLAFFDKLRYDALECLAEAAHIRFEESGDLAYLKSAVSASTEAVRLRPVGHTERPSSLIKLGRVFWEQVVHAGGPLSDLARSIAYLREAVAITLSMEIRGDAFDYIAEALRTRAITSGNIKQCDVESVIGCWKEALKVRPPGHPKRGVVLESLAIAFETRHSITRDRADLERAGAYRQEVQVLCESDGTLGEPKSEEEVVTTSGETVDVVQQEYGDPCGVSPWSSVASL